MEMGFLKNFFTTALHENPPTHSSCSFEELSEEALEAHLSVQRYGSFCLTDAIRPSYDLKVVPSQGYRHDEFLDEESKQNVPVLMSSVSREHLFECFTELLEPLGNVVDVVLETSHNSPSGGHTDLYREHIDMPVLESILWDFEDLLLNDGCTGIAVVNPRAPLEVQFDEHKLLIVYGKDLTPFERILDQCHVDCREEMKFVTEAEHVHSSKEEYFSQFEELRTRLGMDSGYE